MSVAPGKKGARGKPAAAAASSANTATSDAGTTTASPSKSKPGKSKGPETHRTYDAGDIELGVIGGNNKEPLIEGKKASEIVVLESHEESAMRDGIFNVVKRGAQASVVRVLRTGGADGLSAAVDRARSNIDSMKSEVRGGAVDMDGD